MSRTQIHGPGDFDRPRSAYRSAPTLRMQFHWPVHYHNIRGSYHLSIQLEAPAIVWGNDGRCWAFLHDFTPEAIARILTDCREAAYDRRGDSGRPFSCGR